MERGSVPTADTASQRTGLVGHTLGRKDLVTIFCCLPFGIVGIVYASKVDSCWYAGRIDEAYSYSKKARNWSLAGILLSVLLWIVYVILILVGVSWATWWDDSIYYTTACLF